MTGRYLAHWVTSLVSESTPLFDLHQQESIKRVAAPSHINLLGVEIYAYSSTAANTALFVLATSGPRGTFLYRYHPPTYCHLIEFF